MLHKFSQTSNSQPQWAFSLSTSCWMAPGPALAAASLDSQLGVSRESPGCRNSVSQVDGNSDMAPACQVCSCVALWGEGSEKGQWAFPAFLSWRKLFPRSCLDARHFIFSLDDTGIFQAATLVLELRGSMSNSVCMFFKRNCRSFFHWLIPCWVLQPEVVGTYLSATWPEVFPFHRFEYCANREPGIFKSID